MKLTMKLGGFNELEAALKKSKLKAPFAIAGPLRLEAEEIMTKAKRNTPVDLGTLRSSGHVRKPVFKGKTVSVTLGFGGAASAYALAVHEHPSRYSPPTWRGGVSFTSGGPHFLSRPMKEARKGLGRRLARNMKLF